MHVTCWETSVWKPFNFFSFTSSLERFASKCAMLSTRRRMFSNMFSSLTSSSLKSYVCSPHLRLPHLRLTCVLLTYVLRMFSSLTSSSRKSILANAKHLWAGVVKGFLFKTALLSPWENSLAEVRTQLVSWCFEPSQPQRITSGLNTNFKLSPSHSFHKSSHHKSFF